ncbi:MAG: prolyl oligopeptidase family serine peptidase [Bacteroidetes bacterium]|nr:prolyl oligopeptidase family serine peptidase [Bacteroidota bacterium]
MKHLLKKLIVITQSLLIGSFLGCSKQSDRSEVLEKFKSNVYENADYAHPLPYRLYIPERYGSTKKYPLVLYLHGGGSRGKDNTSQIELGAEKLTEKKVQVIQQCFVLAPQCPKGSQWLNTIFKITPFTNVNQDKIPESDSMKMIIRIIKNLFNEFSIDQNRIYVTGPSMGGSGTWDIITRYPYIFAAAVPVNGVSDPSKAHKISHLPIWAFHGEKDSISDVNNTRKMIKALKKNGSTCKFTEYQKKGHNITSMVYRNSNLYTWLFNQER